MKNEILIIGHRGANKIAPENTMKSFRKAIELGADYVEFDVHFTKDNEIVIMHDENTMRTTGQEGVISEMTLEELKELDCGEGEQIPTLQELIDLAKGRIGLQCEIKAEGMASKLVELLREKSLIEDTIMSSFNHDELLKVQELEPKLKLAALEPTGTGWVTDWILKKKLVSNAAEHDFYAIHPFYRIVNEQLVEYAHEKKLKVNPWTVDSLNAMKKLIGYGVDGLITNDIEKAKKVLKRTSKS